MGDTQHLCVFTSSIFLPMFSRLLAALAKLSGTVRRRGDGVHKRGAEAPTLEGMHTRNSGSSRRRHLVLELPRVFSWWEVDVLRVRSLWQCDSESMSWENESGET